MTPLSVGAAAWSRATDMLQMRIERWDARRDGPLTDLALKQKIEALGFETSPRIYPAGARAAAQSDPREGIQGIARGLVKVTVDGESAILGAGDFVLVPANALRLVEVIGASPAYGFEGARAATS